MMMKLGGRTGARIMALALAGTAIVALPVAAAAQQVVDEARVRKIESEVRALQREVFPGGDGRFFTPDLDTGATTVQPVLGTPSTSPVADMLARVDSIEKQLARLTAQSEENANAVSLLTERLAVLELVRKEQLAAQAAAEAAAAAALEPAPVPEISIAQPPAPVPAPVAVLPVRPAAAPPVAPKPAVVATPAVTKPAVAVTPAKPAVVVAAKPAAPSPAVAPAKPPVAVAAKPPVAPAAKPAAPVAAKPAAAAPVAAKPAVAAAPAKPSAERIAAVKAVAKPQTEDAGDDEYSYGFRLWQAGFFPESQQQLKLFIDKYPRHVRISYGRNLLGRALLDDGKAREAADVFLKNYQADKQGDRAPDSLLFLGESMVAMGDATRACIALAEFADTYPAVATGRLAAQYATARAKVKCG